MTTYNTFVAPAHVESGHLTFQVTHGSVTIKVTLYGAVNEERYQKELAIAKWRAEQLS